VVPYDQEVIMNRLPLRSKLSLAMFAAALLLEVVLLVMLLTGAFNAYGDTAAAGVIISIVGSIALAV
jgi:hypothetical protein